MKSLSELIGNRIQESNPKLISERNQVVKEIYDIYTSTSERILRKKENWKRYCLWCRENRLPDSKENRAKFEKNKRFIKEQPIKRFVFFISHIKTQDLYYVKSVMLDTSNRGKSASAWLLSNVSVKKN